MAVVNRENIPRILNYLLHQLSYQRGNIIATLLSFVLKFSFGSHLPRMQTP